MTSISTIDSKGNKTKISQVMTEPLYLDPSKHYAVQLLNWKFKNVFANLNINTPKHIGWNVTSSGVVTALDYDFMT